MDIDFDKLIHLQELDAIITHLSHFLESVPHQIENITKKKEGVFQIVTQAKEKLAQNQKKRRDLESEVKSIREKTTKYNLQLNEVKTNIEYKSLLKEIEESKQRISEREDEILNEMLSADDIEEEIRSANQKYNETEKELSKEKSILQQKQKESEAKRVKLNKEKEELMAKIPDDLIRLYLIIFSSKNGIALSPVTGEFCSLCHMRVRPQVLNELKGNENIILCENCGRILYWLAQKA